jgi:hypothetical protein
MLKIYCTDCGQPTEYASKKPNFCQGCGHAFTAEAAQKKAATKPVVVAEDDEEETASEVPKLEALEVEIVSAKIRRGEKLGEIAFTGSEGSFQRGKEKRLTKKQVIEEFRREAGNSGKSIEIG